ncbi:MAG TPA: BON domain-containing protein [Caldilineaceae bacterium]|nr:BON domain-containing protein [Caldilineaceae bacterium]
MARLDLHIGAAVHCRDRQCGKLMNVVVAPENQAVSDLIIQQGLLQKHARVVPVSTVAHATPEKITLDLYSDELSSFAEYREFEIKEPAPDAPVMPHTSGLASGYGPVLDRATPMVRRRLRDGVAAGMAIIGRKTGVENLSETLGHVDHVVIDGETGQLTEIVMRRGIVPTYYVIPMADVETIDEDHILVLVNKDDVDGWPRYTPRPDTEVLDAVNWALLAEDSPAFRGVTAAVNGGIVRLTGSVPSEAGRRHAEELARLVPGVIDVENELVIGAPVGSPVAGGPVDSAAGHAAATWPALDSRELVNRVSAALAADPRTRDAVIEVIADRGVVTLVGQVKGAETRTAAELVARQPGVTAVINELALNSRG